MRIRPDPSLFGTIKDPDPKLLILAPDPALFHPKHQNFFGKCIKKSEQNSYHTQST